MLRRAAIHGLFLASGVAGLVYQVCWVRGFSLVFGGSIQSASVVTATFLAALGLGGWLAGLWADRNPHRVLRAWGVAELGIAALGLGVAVLLPTLLPLSARWSTYSVGSSGWHELSVGSIALRVGVAALVVLPPAMAMGATLTLVVRDQVAEVGTAGWRISWLYAANTGGAAFGALLTDTALLPLLGLWRTQLLAVGINVAVGLAALWLARAPRSRPVPQLASPVRRAPLPLVAALFFAGFAAMGLELVWFRFLAGALGPYRAVFSLLLAMNLGGQAVGAALGGLAVRRWSRPVLWFAVAQSALVCAALAGLCLHDPQDLVQRQYAIVPAFATAGPWARAGLIHWVNGVTIAWVVLLPAVVLGAAFPLGNAIGQDASDTVGQRLGQLYFSTTLGNVVGALLAGFVLLPGPGLQGSVAVFAVAALLAPALLVRGKPALVLLPAVAALGIFATLPSDRLVWSTFPHGRIEADGVLELREGLEQIVVVTGRAEGPARLWTSGHPMTSTTPHAQRYMRAMAHIPLLLREDPDAALVICVGAGNTLHAATLHGLTRIDAVDLSEDVLAVNRWFAHSNHNALEAPEVAVYVNDGRHHLLLEPPATYDLITLEPPPLAVAGVSSLYTRDFYALAATRLRSDGVIAQWLPAYQVPEPAVRSIVRSFVEVFPHTVLLVGSGRELILLGSAAPLSLEPSAVERRLSDRPRVRADLEAIGLGTTREIASMFAADHATLLAATSDAAAVTDDRPLLEAAAASHLIETHLPADLFQPSHIGAWCPDCVGDLELAEVLDVTEALFASPSFLTYRSAVPDLTSVLTAPDLDDDTLAAIVSSESLSRVLLVPDTLALRAAELWAAGDRASARAHLATALVQAPGTPLLEELAMEFGLAP